MKEFANTFGIIALAFAVFNLVFMVLCFECLFVWYGLPFPIGAIIFGGLGIWKDINPKLAKAGLILGIILLIINLSVGIYFIMK